MIEALTSISPWAIHIHTCFCVFWFVYMQLLTLIVQDNHLNILFLKLGRSAV